MGNTGSTDGTAISTDHRGRPSVEEALRTTPPQRWAVPSLLAPPFPAAPPPPPPAAAAAPPPPQDRRPVHDDPHIIRRRDLLPKLICDKLTSLTNCGSDSQKQRLLVKLFSRNDHAGEGLADLGAFARVMGEGLNVLGPREPEVIRAVFAMYDDACLNVLDYRAFAARVVCGPPVVAHDSRRGSGACGRKQLRSAAQAGPSRETMEGEEEQEEALEAVRRALEESRGAGGLQRLRLRLWSADRGSGILQVGELLAILEAFCAPADLYAPSSSSSSSSSSSLSSSSPSSSSSSSLSSDRQHLRRRRLVSALGAHWTGAVATDLCLARLRRPMARARKQAVRDTFTAMAEMDAQSLLHIASSAPPSSSSSCFPASSPSFSSSWLASSSSSSDRRRPALFVDDETLASCGVPAAHPDVRSGAMAVDAAAALFLHVARGLEGTASGGGGAIGGVGGGGEAGCLGSGGAAATATAACPPPGSTSWFAFLEYHRDLSSCVPDDEVFASAVRDMWRVGHHPQSQQQQPTEQQQHQHHHHYHRPSTTSTARGHHRITTPSGPPPHYGDGGLGGMRGNDGGDRGGRGDGGGGGGGGGERYYIHGLNVPMEGVAMQPGHGVFGEPRAGNQTGQPASAALLLDGVVPQFQEKRKEKNNFKGVGLKPGEPLPWGSTKAALAWRGSGAVQIPAWPPRRP